MTLTEFRKNIYSVFTEVVRTGKTVEIHSKGKSVLICPSQSTGKLDRLRKASKKKAITGNPEDIIHLSWENEWNPQHI